MLTFLVLFQLCIVLAFLLGVCLVVVFGNVPSLRPSFEVDGAVYRLSNYFPLLKTIAT